MQKGWAWALSRSRTAERTALFEACDAALAECVAALEPAWLLGIGGFAAAKVAPLALALGENFLSDEPRELADFLHAVLLTPVAGHHRFLRDTLQSGSAGVHSPGAYIPVFCLEIGLLVLALLLAFPIFGRAGRPYDARKTAQDRFAKGNAS